MSLPIIKENGDEIDVTFYLYTPSAVAAYSFVGTFGVSAVVHVATLIYYRSWHFIPLVLGCILEAFAYYGRAWSHSDVKSIGAWALCSLLSFVAPVFLAATLYMALCRMMLATNSAHHSKISPQRLAKLYIFMDILVFITQLGGIGVQATGSRKAMNIGTKVVAIGLGFQLAMLMFFELIAIRVHIRSKGDSDAVGGKFEIGWYFIAVHIATVAVMLRSIVKLAEFAEGSTGTVAKSESLQYVFDAVPMLTLTIVLLLAHPSRLVKKMAIYKSGTVHQIEV